MILAVTTIVVGLNAVQAYWYKRYSDDPHPLAGQSRVALLEKSFTQKIIAQAAQFQAIQKSQQQIQQHQVQSDKVQDFMLLGVWKDRLAQADLALRRNPSDPLARSMKENAEDEIARINRELDQMH